MNFHKIKSEALEIENNHEESNDDLIEWAQWSKGKRILSDIRAILLFLPYFLHKKPRLYFKNQIQKVSPPFLLTHHKSISSRRKAVLSRSIDFNGCTFGRFFVTCIQSRLQINSSVSDLECSKVFWGRCAFKGRRATFILRFCCVWDYSLPYIEEKFSYFW